MKSLAWIVPSHKPRINYLSILIDSFQKYSSGVDLIIVWSYKTDNQIDLKFKSNSPNIRHIYLDDFYSINDIILMEKTRSIINIKKLLAIKEFYKHYKGLVCTDDEIEFYREFTGDLVNEHFSRDRLFPATNIMSVKSKDDIISRVLAECVKFLANESDRSTIKSKIENFSTYSWFSDLPYYDSRLVGNFLQFFSITDYQSLLRINFFTFEHILYQYYCILNENYEYHLYDWKYNVFGSYNWFECFHLNISSPTYAIEYQREFAPLWCSSSELIDIFPNSFCLFHTDRINIRPSRTKKIKHHIKEIINLINI
jgi:hypothetical protein